MSTWPAPTAACNRRVRHADAPHHGGCGPGRFGRRSRTPVSPTPRRGAPGPRGGAPGSLRAECPVGLRCRSLTGPERPARIPRGCSGPLGPCADESAHTIAHEPEPTSPERHPPPVDFTVDAFRSTPPFDILAKLFGQPEHTDWLDESRSWKRTCYIGDWSFLPQTRFRGPGVPELFSGISVNSFRKFPVGASKHVVQTDAHGHVISEGMARYNLEHGDFRATAEDEDWFVYTADAEIGAQVEVVWGNPGDPVKRIRATVAQAPYKPVRSRADLRHHLADYRAESGPAA